MNILCKHLGNAINDRGVHFCKLFTSCTIEDQGIIRPDGLMPVCNTCERFEAKPKFCYFSCDTTPSGAAVLASMVASARRVGVMEDFHVFANTAVAGAIWHDSDKANIEIKYHTFKVKLLRDQLAELDYDYFVWLDSDNYFVRHPGDLSNLIRDNRIWVLMESEATSPLCKYKEWWGCPIPKYVRLLTGYGVTSEKKYNTNGGMWIVRKEAIAEFAEAYFKIHQDFLNLGYSTTHDETPLAVLGQHPAWVEDVILNTTPATAETWACDWQGVYRDRMPDGLPHVIEDWMTGEKCTANPAIVHAMRSKDVMAGKVKPVAAPKENKNGAGTMLSKYFSKFGYKAVEESETAIAISDNINTASCGGCIALLNKMDAKGPDWCQLNIPEIFKGIDANAANRKVLGVPLNRMPGFKPVVLKFIDFAIAESKRLNGRASKVVLITGVTRGLGLAMAKRFSELGDTVIGCGRSIEAIEELQANFTGSRRFDVVDVTSDEQVATWAALLASAQVYPDLIINNAGVINKPAKLQDISAEEFDSVLRTNLQGTVNVLRHFTADVVVNFSSGWGKSGAADVTPYCASKYAIEGLTAAFAKELPEGKAVVAFNPGVIATATLDVLGSKTKTTPEIWSREAVPFLLGLTAASNGKSLNLP